MQDASQESAALLLLSPLVCDRAARIGEDQRSTSLQGTSRQPVFPAQRGDLSAWYSSARRRPPARATALSDWLVCLGLPRPCAGEAAGTNPKSVLQTGTTRSREVAARIGVTRDEAENPPRLRVLYGEDSKESKPPVKRRVKTHTASAQDSSPPVPWRWRSRAARIRESHRPTCASRSPQRAEVRHTAVDLADAPL